MCHVFQEYEVGFFQMTNLRITNLNGINFRWDLILRDKFREYIFVNLPRIEIDLGPH